MEARAPYILKPVKYLDVAVVKWVVEIMSKMRALAVQCGSNPTDNWDRVLHYVVGWRKSAN